MNPGWLIVGGITMTASLISAILALGTENRAKAVAEELDLPFQDDHIPLGRWQVRVYGLKHAPQLRVVGPAPPGCPPLILNRVDENSIQLDPRLGDQGFDARWQVRTPSSRPLRAAFPYDNEQLIPGLQALLVGEVLDVKLEARSLKPVMRHLERRMDQLLQRLSEGRWHVDGFTAQSMFEQHGVVDGVPLQARLLDDRAVAMEIRAAGVPLRMRHKDHSDGPQTPTGNPVLDALVVVHGDRAPLDQPQVLEACLAVAHGYPGSTLDPEGVVLRSPRPLYGQDLLDAAQAVARAVRAFS